MLPKINGTIAMSILYRTSSILFFYIVSCLIAEKVEVILNVLKIISRYSFPAYLVHVMVLNKLTRYVSTSPEISYYVKYFVLTVFISISVSMIINYIPYSEYLIGIRSKINLNLISRRVISKVHLKKA